MCATRWSAFQRRHLRAQTQLRESSSVSCQPPGFLGVLNQQTCPYWAPCFGSNLRSGNTAGLRFSCSSSSRVHSWETLEFLPQPWWWSCGALLRSLVQLTNDVPLGRVPHRGFPNSITGRHPAANHLDHHSRVEVVATLSLRQSAVDIVLPTLRHCS